MSKESKDRQLTYFEKQRDLLITEIATSMDTVLNNINALNRSLEGTVAVGKEFESVAALWANFYDAKAQMERMRPLDTEVMTGSDAVEPLSTDVEKMDADITSNPESNDGAN